MNNNIQLLQSYYRFLSLGKYMEFLIQGKNFSKEVLDIAIVTWEKSHFGIRSSLVKTLLKQIHEHPDQKNIFWYLVEISSFKGIFWSMRELLENDRDFKTFVEKRLGDQYFAFEQVIRLIRNVLSHIASTNLTIKTDYFIKQRDFLVYEKKDPTVFFDFVYSKYWKEWTGSKEYWIHIKILFTKIKEGETLFDIVSLHQLYLLWELCYNLCELFKSKTSIKKPTKKPSKTIWKYKGKNYSKKSN